MTLSFEGIVNARDLGGTRVPGGVVRSGLLLRTAHLGTATDADVERLTGQYRLRRIFDFRSYPEAESMPDRHVPGAENMLLPTLDKEAEDRSGEAVPDETWLNLPKHIVGLSFTQLFHKKARELYPSLVMSEFSQLQYAAFLSMVVDTEDGAVLWHCSQGKDRTGIGAALLLAALGAGREAIVEDFDLSNAAYTAEVAALCAQVEAIGGGETQKEVIRAFMGVSTKNFEATLDLIDERWGSLDAYLGAQLGVSPDDRRILRRRYIE